MRKELLLFYFFLIIFISTACNAEENVYINREIGFSIKYPEKIKIREDYYGDDFKYYLVFNSISLDHPRIKSIIRSTKEEYINKIKNEKIDFAVDPTYNGSGKYIKYNNETIGFSLYLLGDKTISNRLEFIKDNYLVTLELYFNDKNYSIYKQFPMYFEIDGAFAKWKEPASESSKNFYKLISSKSKKIPKELIDLEEYFDKIIDSIELFEPKSIYTFPIIDNLRFRETPTLDGKFIRMLNKKDKLELLEKGKEETISGTKGTWVKVKTEQGEVGWCFDAYLEEVKKK